MKERKSYKVYIMEELLASQKAFLKDTIIVINDHESLTLKGSFVMKILYSLC